MFCLYEKLLQEVFRGHSLLIIVNTVTLALLVIIVTGSCHTYLVTYSSTTQRVGITLQLKILYLLSYRYSLYYYYLNYLVFNSYLFFIIKSIVLIVTNVVVIIVSIVYLFS